jgi:subtilisin family serine protease
MTGGARRERTTIDVAPNQPWQPESARGAVRGRVIVRLAPGEVPEHLPSILSVMQRKAVAPSRLGNRIDAVVSRFSPALRVSTAFAAANTRSDRQRWDPVEHATGLSRTLRIDIDPDASLVDLVSALNDLAIVEQASPQYLSVTPFDRAGHDETAHESERPAIDPRQAREMIGASAALAMEPGDTALIVAIVDSGVDLHHPELRDRLRPGIDTVDLPPNGVPRSMQLIGDWSGVDRLPQDYVGHGTACAGIIGARGEQIPEGLAGAARMLAVRVLAAAQMTGRPRVTALGAITDIDLGLKIAIDLGARVFNLSFGTPETALRKDDPRPHADIIAYARRRGCVLVAASGNSGDTTRYYPACLDGVIAVGAVAADRTPTSFMTRGDHVDLCAPGERIVSTGLGGLQLNTGTSFAAPFVTGACALVMARAARLSQPLEGDDVRELLMRTASPFPRGASTIGCGTGILDVPAALKAIEAPDDDEHEEANEQTTPVTRAPRQVRTRDP